MIPLIMMAVGTGVQIIGQRAANIEQAIAERANQRFYDEQANYAQDAALRAERLSGFDYAYKVGQQIGDYAASGVDISGSAALTVGGSLANEISELAAIRKKGALDVKLARMRAGAAGSTADTLSSGGYNLMQGGMTALSNYTRSEGMGTWGKTDANKTQPKYTMMEG